MSEWYTSNRLALNIDKTNVISFVANISNTVLKVSVVMGNIEKNE
jgi:hypothetical protein